MILPSGAHGRTTETVGYFELPANALARRLCDELGEQWQMSGPLETSLSALAETLERSSLVDRYRLVDLSSWTALLTNGPLGTDVGVLPSWVARKMGARGIRATAAIADDVRGRYGATILEVFDPDATDHRLRRRRTISSADDGGTWTFDQSGEPFEFENTAKYQSASIRDRFGPDMLASYLRALGVPIDLDPGHLVVYAVDRPRPDEVD